MFRFCFFILAGLIPVFGQSQYSRFSFEPSLALQHVHHVDCKLENKDPHRGMTLSPGFRLNFDATKRFTLSAVYIRRNVLGEVLFPVERAYGLHVRYSPLGLGKTKGVRLSAESGLIYSSGLSRFEVPFQVGVSVPVNRMLSWNVRLNLPVLSLISGENGTFRYVSYGLDTGISLRFGSPGFSKGTRFGNPFILQ